MVFQSAFTSAILIPMIKVLNPYNLTTQSLGGFL